MFIVYALLTIVVLLDLYLIVNMLIYIAKEIARGCFKREINIKTIFDYV